jgi:hypothetical protein
MEPFIPKSFLNTNQSARVLVEAISINGFPSGHADLDGGHPSLMKDPLEKVLVTEVPSALLRPEIIEEEATEDIKRLPRVKKVTDMVAMETGGVIFTFVDSLPE